MYIPVHFRMHVYTHTLLHLLQFCYAIPGYHSLHRRRGYSDGYRSLFPAKLSFYLPRPLTPYESVLTAVRLFRIGDLFPFPGSLWFDGSVLMGAIGIR